MRAVKMMLYTMEIQAIQRPRVDFINQIDQCHLNIGSGGTLPRPLPIEGPLTL